MTLFVTMFGRFQVRQNNAPVSGLDARKVQELLAYLLVYPRVHSRDELATLLWSDRSTSISKKYLRQALWQLQSSLNDKTLAEQSQVIIVDTDWVHINQSIDIQLDITEFEQCFLSAQSIPADSLSSEQVEQLKAGIALYSGHFLNSWYQDWCIYERERFLSLYLSMQEKLLAYFEHNQDYEAGMVHGLEILRFEKAQERTHRCLMRLYYMSGNRTAALRQFQSCVAALNEELGVGPAKSTVALVEKIQSDQAIVPESATKSAEVATSDAAVGQTPALPVLDNNSLGAIYQQLLELKAEIERYTATSTHQSGGYST